jgi:flavin reductase (DIM6/NTAB) family NADH-FMN oxidoreductase RutF
MSDSKEISPLAQALGRVPTGLYIVSTMDGDAVLGFLGSFVMQASIEVPQISVAVGQGREHLEAIRKSGRFAVSILDAGSQKSMGAFFKKYEGGETPFDHVEHQPSPAGLPVLSNSLAWLECEFSGEFDAGDHVVVFGKVVAGEQLRDGDPSIHLRKNGLGY